MRNTAMGRLSRWGLSAVRWLEPPSLPQPRQCTTQRRPLIISPMRRRFTLSRLRHFNNSPDWLTLFRATRDGAFIYEDLNPARTRLRLEARSGTRAASRRGAGRRASSAAAQAYARLRQDRREPALHRSADHGRCDPDD